MAVGSLEPVSSAVINTVDLDRCEEVEAKHELVRQFLRSQKFDALLLRKPSNFAWFTCGGDSRLPGSDESAASLFISLDARLLICNNTNSGQLFDKEVSGLGFQLKERPWQESYEGLLTDLCRGRDMGTDTPMPKTEHISHLLPALRTELSEFEQERMRELGRDLAHAIEATARSFNQGDTEAAIAGQLSHRLLKREITPTSIQVLADGQGKRYRNWKFGSDQVERFCTISAVGQRHGLHLGAARTVTFETIPASLKEDFLSANLVQTAGLFFSHPDESIESVWKRVERIFDKFDAPDEWRQVQQGCLTGYQPNELTFMPKSEFELKSGMAAYWHPSVRTAMVGDSMLVDDEGCEILTPAVNWPHLEIEVKGNLAKRPNILKRD